MQRGVWKDLIHQIYNFSHVAKISIYHLIRIISWFEVVNVVKKQTMFNKVCIIKIID
jgi:hypothetical protein